MLNLTPSGIKLTPTGVKINTNLVWTSHNTGGVEFNTGVFAVFPRCIYDPTLVEIHQSMWTVEPNVNLFSQQQTTGDKEIPMCLSCQGRWGDTKKGRTFSLNTTLSCAHGHPSYVPIGWVIVVNILYPLLGCCITQIWKFNWRRKKKKKWQYMIITL